MFCCDVIVVSTSARLGAAAALPAALAFEQEVLFRLYCSDHGQEGIEAFQDKREPQFRGR